MYPNSSSVIDPKSDLRQILTRSSLNLTGTPWVRQAPASGATLLHNSPAGNCATYDVDVDECSWWCVVVGGVREICGVSMGDDDDQLALVSSTETHT